MRDQQRRTEFTQTDAELLKMMAELKVGPDVDAKKLRLAYFEQIKLHHSDKGGDPQKAQNITRAYRVLKEYLEASILLPGIDSLRQRNGFSKPAPERSGCRPGSQSQRAAPDGFEDFGDFETVRKNRRKGRRNGTSQSTHWQQNGTARGNSADESRTKGPNVSKAPPKFINGYTYEEGDMSTYDDPMEQPDRQKDGLRTIRGGLVLYKDLQRGQNLPPEYQEMGTTFTEDDLVDNPIFEPILEKMRPKEDTLRGLTEKMRTYVYISWAFDGGAATDARILLQKVKIERLTPEDDSLYEIKVPAKSLEGDILTPGLHVEVKAPSDGRLFASAVIEQVKRDELSLVVFFVDPLRLCRILALCRQINVTINCSAFVYRSQLRSIDYIETSRHSRDMGQILFPKPEFTETLAEFTERRARELAEMPFHDEEDHQFNEDQKNAVYSIVNREHRHWPFILFGPPGTGKTITLIEAIRHLVLADSQNRILVCTPSKMAADNFAESLMNHGFLDNKYIFRMHSLSTMAHNRNKKLDPISYLAKDTKNRFFGIPDRHNLKVFRVIISTLSTSAYLMSAGGLRGYFTHILVDEAGQATEPETWIPIGGLVGPQTSVILAGDPKQLGPVLNVNSMKWFGFDNSMLKRIMNSRPYVEEGVDDRVFVILRQTYRSHYTILRPCSYLFYDNMLIVDDSQGRYHKLCEWEGLPTIGFPIIFHSSIGSQDQQGVNRSHKNEFEAEVVCRYVERLLSETELSERDIGVISPYKSQVILLRHSLASHPGITIDSVEGFQGSEREVIIMSTVRQNDMGFLRCDLRLNTSISRAKYLLIVVGNEELLSQHMTWKKFIFYCRFHGGFLNREGQKMEPIEDGE